MLWAIRRALAPAGRSAACAATSLVRTRRDTERGWDPRRCSPRRVGAQGVSGGACQCERRGAKRADMHSGRCPVRSVEAGRNRHRAAAKQCGGDGNHAPCAQRPGRAERKGSQTRAAGHPVSLSLSQARALRHVPWRGRPDAFRPDGRCRLAMCSCQSMACSCKVWQIPQAPALAMEAAGPGDLLYHVVECRLEDG